MAKVVDGYMDLGSIIEVVSSSGERRSYAVRKALRVLESVSGVKADETFAGIISGRIDVYDLLRRFVRSLQEEGLAPKSVRFYLSLLLRMLRMAGADVKSELIRYRVPLPVNRIVKIDRAPTVDELRRILAVVGARNRALFLMLASTGMRIGECLQLRLGDLQLDDDPPYVDVRTAKSGVLRRVYLTKECVETLKAYLGSRLMVEPPTAWLWPRRGDASKPLRKTHAQQYWYVALKKVGLDMRDSSGLGYQLHLHSLRKFYRTQLERAGVSRTVISLWMGQVTGLDVNYFRPTEPQLVEEWRKAEPYLTLSRAEDIEELKKSTVLEVLRRLAVSFGIDPMKVRVEKQKKLGRDPTSEEEIEAIQNEIKKLRSVDSDPKKIISEDELEHYLAEGWDVQTVLPSGRILIRKTAA
ncbi:MAG: tyrosine-type recombinase/integrase [Thaumarchaeota archaeon]|nr:tyrosine-type recombinase/integrase [Nitrososphaerota archaeon]